MIGRPNGTPVVIGVQPVTVHLQDGGIYVSVLPSLLTVEQVAALIRALAAAASDAESREKIARPHLVRP